MCEARLCAATGAGQDFLYGGVLIVYEKRGMCDTVTSSCTLADAEDSFWPVTARIKEVLASEDYRRRLEYFRAKFPEGGQKD